MKNSSVKAPPPPPSADDIVTTSFLLGNLHCPSCVALIRSRLHETFGDNVPWVSPNLVTSVVTVEHRDNSVASVRKIEQALEDVGFEVLGFNTTSRFAGALDRGSQVHLGESSHDNMELVSRGLDSFFRRWRPKHSPSTKESALAAHIENCEACKLISIEKPTRTSGEMKESELLRTSSIPSDASVTKPQLEPLQGIVTGAQTEPPLWRATLAVGGMTCASCSGTITEELSKIPWVSNVAVNLIANSATVDFTEDDKAQAIVDAIEDLGYDATLNNVVNMNEERQATDEREVEIEVDGIFCRRCPKRITQTLRSLNPEKLDILREATVEFPILKLRYTPDAPTFTIRQILKAIEAADTSLTASIYHPPSLDEQSRISRERHRKSLLRREILTVIVTIPTFILGIVYMNLVPDSNHTKMYLMKPWTSDLSRLDVAMFILATPIYFYAASIFHVRAIKDIRRVWSRTNKPLNPEQPQPWTRRFHTVAQRFYKFGSMDLLISLGTSIAYISSVAQMIAAAARDGKTSGSEFYFDSVVFLTLFLLAGRLLEEYAKKKTATATEMLAKLRPTQALLLTKDMKGDQTTTTVDSEWLDFGDMIRVPHGASPPADGVVVGGESTFDESSLTGESRPIKKGKGDQVFAGTINKAAPVTVRVTGASGQSMLDQIVEAVREGQAKHAPIQRIADTLTGYFVPIITLIAVVTWIVWIILGVTHVVAGQETASAGGAVTFALQYAISVFVVACPCGLGLAAPTAVAVGAGLAAKHGILAKGGGEAFEKASKIDCVVFDKTGTLTEGGEPQITDSAVFPDREAAEDERRLVLSALKGVEENSTHPIAKAIVAFCGEDTRAAEVQHVEEIPGRGMKATGKGSGGKTFDLAVGNEMLMRDVGLALSSAVATLLERWKNEAKSVALVAMKPTTDTIWELAAAVSMSDPIRPEALPIIRALHARGTQVWMLSGDNATTARAVAQRIGIPSDKVLAEVLPSQKADKIKYLQSALQSSSSSGRRAMVAMVGDGINDSPALTAADVGIAIGTGADIAISLADFVLTAASLTAVLTLLELSQAVLRRIKFNFGWAIIYNLLAVPVAAGCLYAVTTSSGSHVKLDPAWAAMAMALSSISVVLSSLCLRLRVPGVGFRPTQVAAA